jgi:hypothetical protein
MADNKDPYLGLIDIMRFHGAESNAPGMTIGEVVTPFPNLKVKVGDLQLDKDNMLISDILLAGYKRAYIAQGEATIRYPGSFAKTTVVQLHSHQCIDMNMTTAPDDFSVHGDGDIEHATNDKWLTFTDSLRVGDKLMMQPMPDGQLYVILARVVKVP